jgi:hypothetical protein
MANEGSTKEAFRDIRRKARRRFSVEQKIRIVGDDVEELPR